MRGFSVLAAGLLLTLAACNGSSPTDDTRPLPDGPSIVLIAADTLRPDRLSAYGYERETSPAIAAMAAEGLVFERAYAHASWTLPSTMTLFTSLLPSTHGVTGPFAALGGAERGPEVYSVSLGGEARTLPELLHEAGYATAAVTENGWVSGRFGFSRGFDSFVEERKGRIETTCAATLEYLDAPPERPFFLFMHSNATQAPWALPEQASAPFGNPERRGLLPWGERPSPAVFGKFRHALFPLTPDDEAAVRDLYDAAVLNLDACIAELMARVRRLDRPVAVVFLSDHGEELYEHGAFGHGATLYDEILRVPLVIWAPDEVPATRRADPVGLVDVMPTVLGLAGLPVPPGLEGRNLLARSDPAETRLLVAEGHTRDGAVLQTMVRGPFKLVRYGSGSRTDELYDLIDDPGEQSDLAGQNPDLTRQLVKRLVALVKAAEKRAVPLAEPATVLGEEERENAQALGYPE